MTNKRDKAALMVTWAAPSVFSGAGKQAVRLTRRLRERGREVVVFSGDRESWLPRRVEENGVPIVRWPTRAWTPRIEKVLLSASLAIHLLAHPRRYHVVHLHGLMYLLRVLRPLRRALGFSIVYKPTMCGKDDAERVRDTAGPRVLGAVDRWICIAQPFYDAALAAGVPEDRLVRVPNGIDFERFRPLPQQKRSSVRRGLGVDESETLWVTVGALIPRKRIDLIVEAWGTLPEPRPRLAIIGPTDARSTAHPVYSGSIIERVNENGLKGSVVFLGQRSDVPEVLGAADGFVFASRQEGLPNAVIEALASGLPVVTTAFESVDDVLGAANGHMRVVDPDPGSLAEGVAAASRPGQAPPALLRDYDLETIVARYEALYDELLATGA